MRLYGLRVKKTGQLCSVSAQGTHPGEFCGTYQAQLEDGRFDYPLYTTKRLADVDAVLRGVPWFNSNLSQPQLGSLKAEDLEIVEVVVNIVKS
jgi:hypothetical protein